MDLSVNKTNKDNAERKKYCKRLQTRLYSDDVIVPVATRSNASSFTRNNAGGFKTELQKKIFVTNYFVTIFTNESES